MGNSERLARLASRQHGVFSASQVRATGFDKHAVTRRIASGEWVRLDYRVFGFPSAPPTWERQMWAALLSRPRALVGGGSAAYLHRFRGFRKARPTIVVPGSANARSEIARVIRSAHFDELETVRVEGFPMTSIAETLLQLAREIPTTWLEDVVDDLILAGRIEAELLVPVVEREAGRRRRGIGGFREIVNDRLAIAHETDSSYLERILEGLLSKGRVPDWFREYPFSLADQPSRVDVYIPEWRLVIEADGRNFHARRTAFEVDRRRDNELAVQGLQVVRLTYQMLTEDPDGCLATIAAVGAVRSA